MYRLGFTESTLLFFWYLDVFHKEVDKNLYIFQQFHWIKWLYTTSGFYDKTIDLNNHKMIIESNVYNLYFSKILHAIMNYNGTVTFYFHEINPLLKIYLKKFLEYINVKYLQNVERIDKQYISRECVYEFIKDKRIIIINNLGVLIKKQYESGNLKKIYNDLPNIQNIDYIEPSYTFFNNGPYNSILESVEYIYKNIDAMVNDTDNFIISCGAYSILIADYIHTKYNKEVIIVGGDLACYFGINTKRGYTFDNEILQSNKSYFINVPDEMKPANYKFIEDGCYW